ncbi:acyl-CoA dehydrogenase family protein [Thermodesulfobacteriota bacterium]
MTVYFTESQKRFRQEIRDFAYKKLARGSEERAKLDHVTERVIKELAAAGLLGLTTPVEYGGRPKDYVSIGIVFEEICGVDFSPFAILLSHAVVPLMMKWASEEVREEWLPLLNKGEKLVCFGNTEPDCGSDAAAIRTRAIRDGDDYILNGEKTSISAGMQADAILLTAKTDFKTGTKGITCFFVPCRLPGIARSRFVDMGAHPSGRASVSLNDVRVPARFRIGKEGEGFTEVMRGFDFARVLVALSGVGLAGVSLTETIEYTKKRMRSGRPLCEFEGIAFKLSEVATLIEASRLLCYQALKLRDENLSHSKESAMAKWYTAECTTLAIHDMLIIFGYKGYSEEIPIEQRLRDIIGTKIGDGTAEIMKLIIAREILGNKFKPVM